MTKEIKAWLFMSMEEDIRGTSITTKGELSDEDAYKFIRNLLIERPNLKNYIEILEKANENNHKKSKTELPFPKLMINPDNGKIHLMGAQGNGVLVCAGENIGEHYGAMNMLGFFEDFHGTVEITQ